MKYESVKVAASKEVLKRRLGGELFATVTIKDTEFASKDVVVAGSPIAADGTFANGATAVGILLNDVHKDNPNGSLIKAFATVNVANINANIGTTLDDAVKTALPNIIFE